MTLAQALATAAALGLARLDAQLLLLHALGRGDADRAWLLAHDDDELEDSSRLRFEELCGRRVTDEPLAYLVGYKEFFGLNLMVDARVLVPRPDTETLVEWALELLPPQGDSRVIDLGTGSGAIALAIKHARPDAYVEATDQSEAALEVARANARRLSLDVTFRSASWLCGTAERFDLIVSNPPYIPDQDPHLPGLAYEPRSALVAGVQGLDDLRTLIGQAPPCLRHGGWLLLEHGHDQAPVVRSLLVAAGLRGAASRRDLAGIERCSGAHWLELG